jgi:hypothetical protein
MSYIEGIWIPGKLNHAVEMSGIKIPPVKVFGYFEYFFRHLLI